MLIPKDKALTVVRERNRIEFRWRRPRSEALMALVFPTLFAILFASIAFVPNTSYPDRAQHPSMDALGTAAVIFLLGALTSLAFLNASFQFVADDAGVSRFTKLFGMNRVTRIAAPFKQFYIKGLRSGSVTSPKLYALSENDEEELILPNPLALTMARQMWAELQAFYHLEDLDVLGEVEHERLSDDHRKHREYHRDKP